MNSIYPKLQLGDTIGIFTSSYPITAIAKKETLQAKEYLENHGFKVKLGKLTFQQDFYRSGSIQERVEEFNELLYDEEVKCLMASVGGFISNALLPYIDYEYLKNNAKVIIGHSDITALLLAIYEKTKIITFYGPNFVTTFGHPKEYLEIPFTSFKEVTSKDLNLPYVYQLPSYYSDDITDWGKDNNMKKKIENKWVTVATGVAKGRLIGGNLNTINAIIGSEYMPEIRNGDILFIEDTEKWAAYCERYFSMLKIHGIFDKIAGLIIGKHKHFDDQGTNRTNIDILLEVLGEPKFPILADFDCCHTLPILTLPLGAIVELNTIKQTVTLCEE